MKQTGVKKLAFVLKILVIIMFAANLFALLLIPGLVVVDRDWRELFQLTSDPREPISPVVFFLAMWPEVFRHITQGLGNKYVTLTLFLLFCGACTAAILWQAKRVLDTILKGTPFCAENEKSLKRAAVCCFLISAFALVRMVWGVWYYRSILPALSYNSLFIPIFLMGGLLCLVLSALFRQAAELKAENDLTI